MVPDGIAPFDFCGYAMQTKFVLQPCKVREDRFVELEVEPLVLTASELVERFAPDRDYTELMKLRSMRPGGFLGRIRGGRTGHPVVFVFMRDDRRNSVAQFLKRDPTLMGRVLEVFRVDEANWGSRFIESESGKKDSPSWTKQSSASTQEMRR